MGTSCQFVSLWQRCYWWLLSAWLSVPGVSHAIHSSQSIQCSGLGVSEEHFDTKVPSSPLHCSSNSALDVPSDKVDGFGTHGLFSQSHLGVDSETDKIFAWASKNPETFKRMYRKVEGRKKYRHEGRVHRGRWSLS